MTQRCVHVIGAHGRSGRYLCNALAARGDKVVPIVRRTVPVIDGLSSPRIATLEDHLALKEALHDAALVVSTANAQFTPNILAAMPDNARFLAMGSTRMFTQFPDRYAQNVRRALDLMAESRTQSMMLLPSMIYGAEDDITTWRLVSILKRLPIIPLPKGGRTKIQPIHQDDVTAALIAAIDLLYADARADLPLSVVIAGPQATTYRDYVLAVLRAAGLRRRPVITVPTALLKSILPILKLVPGAPKVTTAELDRLTENRCFSIEDMSRLLHVRPRPLDEGLQALLNPKLRSS